MAETTKLAALTAKASRASPAVTSSPATGAATNWRRTPAVHCSPLAATSARSETRRGTTAFERGENDAVPTPSRRLTATAAGNVGKITSRTAAAARKRSTVTSNCRAGNRSTIA
jgi:hypothetical protein